jgi:Flp pilus assembly protein TadB
MHASKSVDSRDRCERRPGVAVGRWLRARQRRELAQQLPAAIESIAAALDDGEGLLPAVQAVALRAPGRVAAALAPLLEVPSGGVALEQALLALRERIGGAELTLLAHAVAVAGRSAQPRSEVFRRLARRLCARRIAEHKVAALVARVRWLSGAAGALPLAALAWQLHLDPVAARTLLARPIGWTLLALLALLVLQGLRLLGRAVRVDDPEG